MKFCALVVISLYFLVVRVVTLSESSYRCSPDKIEKDVDVLILGAGSAGIAAARTLKNAGLNFFILEGSDRPGGRIRNEYMSNTDPNDSTKIVISAGAQWLHGRWNPLYNYAFQHGLLVKDSSSEMLGVYFTETEEQIDSNIVEYVGEIVDDIMISTEKFADNPGLFPAIPSSLDTYMTNEFTKRIKKLSAANQTVSMKLLEYHKLFQIIDYAAFDIRQMSAKGFGRSQKIWNRWDHITVSGGLTKIIEMMANDLGAEQFSFNKIVKRIDLIGQKEVAKVLVECEDGTWYRADHVIVTFSLGVLKRKIENLFSPRLPISHRNAIKCLGFGPITKIFLQFETNFWGSNEGMQLVFTDPLTYDVCIC